MKEDKIDECKLLIEEHTIIISQINKINKAVGFKYTTKGGGVGTLNVVLKDSIESGMLKKLEEDFKYRILSLLAEKKETVLKALEKL